MGALLGVSIFMILLFGGFIVIYGTNEAIKFLERKSLLERFTKMYEKELGE
jgi:hypothetical protein